MATSEELMKEAKKIHSVLGEVLAPADVFVISFMIASQAIQHMNEKHRTIAEAQDLCEFGVGAIMTELREEAGWK
jgi:hypothetical protein